MANAPTEEDLRVLDTKIKQLRLDYERYFLGTRPREPVMARGEVEKLILIYSNMAIQNTALRFKFSSINSRYQAFKRQWSDILRKIEEGTYTRHRFKADLHARERAVMDPRAPQASAGDSLFAEYRDARLACGQNVKSLSHQKFEKLIDKQRKALRERYGDASFRFRVVVEQGKVKLKASRQRAEAS